MSKFKTTIWRKIITLAVLAVLIYVGMVGSYIPLSQGGSFDARYTDMNLHIGEKIPPPRFYATLWGDLDFAGSLLCLFLGFLCLVLGIIRAFNRLECKQILLISLFSALFSVMSLTLSDFAARYFNKELLFYLFWLTFFAYPVALCLYFRGCLSFEWRRRLVAPVFILAGYSAAAFVMYFAVGLPFDIPERLYTIISLIAAAMYLSFGIFTAKDKSTGWYIRGIVAFWLIWIFYLSVKMLTGANYSLHNEYRAGFFIMLVFMFCYVLFTNVHELVKHKSDIMQMEIKAEFMLENYKALESHITQIAELKHEMRHHLLAISVLSDKAEYERLAAYLNELQSGFAEIEEPVACGNLVVQSVLGYAARRAKELGFEIGFEVLPLPEKTIPDADIVSLLMNLLENALQSCAKIRDSTERNIKVRLKMRDSYLCLSVINSTCGRADSYADTKDDALLHGHGIEIVCKIAEKYGGIASFERIEGYFNAIVALPIE